MLSTTPTFGSVIVNVDAKGNGTLTAPDGFVIPTTGAVGADAGPGGKSNALVYDLFAPPALATGDLLVYSPGGVLEDVIRFEDAAGSCTTGCLVFYATNVLGAIANIGVPSAFFANALSITAASDGSLVYTPALGQPGYVAAGDDAVTIVLPRVVPEPATFALLGIGVLGVAATRRRNAKRTGGGIPPALAHSQN